MTKSEVRYEFERIRSLDNRINRDCAMLTDLRNQLYGYKAINYGSERVQGGGAISNHVDGILDKLSDTESKINILVDELVTLKLECQRWINLLSEDVKQDILYARYFKYEPIADIALKLGYTTENVYIIRNKALSEISSKL